MRRNPYGDSRENSYLLQAYVTQENGRAKMGDVLFAGTPEKCRELMGQLKSGELTEGDVKQLYAKAQETAQIAGQDKDTFSIYQIKGGDETRDFRFEPYDRLQAAGNVVDRANYELVYTCLLYTSFLNQVDEADLMALMEDGSTEAAPPAVCSCTEKCEAGKVNVSCPVCKDNMTACSGKEAEPETEEPPEQPKEKGNAGGLVLFLVVALLGGGASF